MLVPADWKYPCQLRGNVGCRATRRPRPQVAPERPPGPRPTQRSSLTPFFPATVLRGPFRVLRIRARPLAPNRQTFAVPKAPIAADITEPGDVLLNLATELALHHVLVVQKRGELGQVVLREVAGSLVGIDPGPNAKLLGEEGTNPVNVRNEITVRLSLGISTPRIRGIPFGLRRSIPWRL